MAITLQVKVFVAFIYVIFSEGAVNIEYWDIENGNIEKRGII
jgi:hypothetical protein